MAKRYRARRVRKPTASVNGPEPIPARRGHLQPNLSAVPKLRRRPSMPNISFIDVRDKHAADPRARIGLRLPIYPQQCPACGCAITYDEAES